MRVVVLLTSVPIGVVTVMHWHWLKDRAVDFVVDEVIRRGWYAMNSVLEGTTDRLLASLLAVLLPDMSAIVNWSAILGGLVFLVAAVFPTPHRRALVVAGVAGVAIGAFREASRKNSNKRLSLIA